MAAYGPASLVYQIQALQTKTVIQKCIETDGILRRTSTKELRLLLPALLQSIFGWEGEPGWGLERLSQSQYTSDFDALHKFLGPEGPLLNVVYSLQADPYTAYEFPFRCLPGPSRHTIEEGGLPMFYVNKLQMHGFSIPTVTLNAFEMYMFHFAYALVSPAWQQGGTLWSSRMFDWLYPTLVDEYLSYFLPLDSRKLPTIPHMPAVVRSPVTHFAGPRRPVHQVAPYSPPRPSTRVSLFRPHITLAQKQYTHSSPVLDSSEAETWHSETMLQIFVEFWLNQNSLVTDVPTFAHGAMEHFMPSLNHVMVVRMMVKYLHYFSNTASAVITSPYQQRLETPLSHFKRTVVGQIVQKKLYWFLRHAFDRWPLDCYFRMVLETWLSYIQPWRYTDVEQYNRSKGSRRSKSETRSQRVDDRWYQFIEDNLLFYAVLFQKLLPRLYRMDLTSPQSAYILFRLTKVFSLPNLAASISNAEQELCGISMSQTVELGGSYLSATQLQPSNPTLPPQLSDLESAGFQYHLLFCDRTRQVMKSLLQKALDAHVVVVSSRSVAPAAGVWSWLSSLFDDMGSSGNFSTYSTQLRLEESIKNIAQIFHLQQSLPEKLHRGKSEEILNDSTLLEEEEILPDCIDTVNGPQLTDLGRYQIINKLRHFDHWQTDDPDLQPIRSFENATLVRFLYQVCSALNSQFSSQIWQLYQRKDFLGRLAKVYLAPPLSPKQRIQSPVSPLTAQRLRQPRLSLRILASYQTLVLLCILYLVMYLWVDCGVLAFLLLVGMVLVLYGVLRAAFSRSHYEVDNIRPQEQNMVLH